MVIERTCGFKIQRGTSLSHVFVDEDPPVRDRASYFTRRDVRYMVGMGLDHVRIPISEKLFWAVDGRPHHAMFTLLDDVISMAIDGGLRVILCLHVVRSHPHPKQPERGYRVREEMGVAPYSELTHSVIPLFAEECAVEVLCRLWRDLSGRFRHFPIDCLAYELLNEPFAPRHREWNRVWHAARKVVRACEPERLLVIGSNLLSIAPTIKRLVYPQSDPNLLPSFHLYDPMMLTHYKAPWLNNAGYSGRVRYPGRPVPAEDIKKLSGALHDCIAANNQPITKQLLRSRVAEAKDAAAREGYGIHCGEFGCVESAPRELRNAWLGDLVDILEGMEIPWTQWDWKGNFGLLDRQTWQPAGTAEALRLKKPRRLSPPAPHPSLWQRLRVRVMRTVFR